jgi:transposase
MVVLGVDAHTRSHTVVAVDQLGRKLSERTTGTTSQDHLGLLSWAERFGDQRLWAVEDCRHLSRRLERDLLSAGERIVRVPTKLMAHARDAARSDGKSDPIDALAVARAALREPQLPAAQLEGSARAVRLLVDHRDNLVAERTRAINRLRWHLHELDPSWQPPARTLWRPKHLRAIGDRLASVDGTVARLARGLVERCRQLSTEIAAVDKELEVVVRPLAPALLEVCGCATITAAKLVGETADVRRFGSDRTATAALGIIAINVRPAARDAQSVQDRPPVALQRVEQPGGTPLPGRPAPPGHGVRGAAKAHQPAQPSHDRDPSQGRQVGNDSCGGQPCGHAGGGQGHDPPGQAADPGGELRGPPPLVLGAGGGSGAADAGPDPHRHHRRQPTGSWYVVLVVVEVGEQGGQVSVAEGTDRHSGLLVVTGGPEAIGAGVGLQRVGPGHGGLLWC